MTEVVLSQFRGEGALLASGNDNGADDQCTTTRTARRIRPMEQFDPEIQRTFNHAAKIDPFGDPQAEYEHAQRVARQAQNHFAPVPAPFSDLVPNETQKPAAALLIDGPIPYFD